MPTRIYVKPVIQAVKKDLIKGTAHITGGGLPESTPRMLPKHLAASLDSGSWDVPKVLRWLKKAGDIYESEFARTLTTGLGMVIVVAAEKTAEGSKQLRNAGEKVWRVASLWRGPAKAA